MENKSILFFVYNFNTGGAEWVVTNLANEFVNNGLNVKLISIKKGKQLDVLDSKVKVAYFNGNLLKAVLELFRELLSNNFSVCFATQRGAAVILALVHLISFSKSKLIIREAASNFKNSFENRKVIVKPFWFLLFRMAYTRADKLIVNSFATEKDLRAAKIISPKYTKVFQIDNPVNIDYIIENSKESIKNEYGTPSEEVKTIVSIGRLVPKKNMDLVIKAIKSLLSHGLNYRLLIVGEGPERKKLQKLIREYDLIDNVFLLGHLNNPYPILKDADVFVLASSWEGFGMVIVEALALGVQVVATRIDSGPKQILLDGKFGCLVEVGDEKGIVDSIIKLIALPIAKEKLVNRAYDFDKKRIAQIYQSIIFAKL